MLTHPDGGTNTNAGAVADIDNNGDVDFIEATANSLNTTRRVNFVWTNNNPVNTVTLAVDNTSIAEAGGVATITATVKTAPSSPITVNLGFTGTATSGTDYAASGTQIVIPAGSTSGSITVTVDRRYGGRGGRDGDRFDDEHHQRPGWRFGDGDDPDDDEPVIPDVAWAWTTDHCGSGWRGDVHGDAFGGDQQRVTVDLAISGTATSGTDYTASGTQIVIAAGQTSGSITVTAVDDTVDEVNETVVVDIDSVTGGNESGSQQATTTIVDDDGPTRCRSPR